MEGKTSSRDDEKKELSLEKLGEIEKAYLDLMKAYSSCLSTVDLKKAYIYAHDLKKIYSFSGDKVPGEDSERLLRYLKDVLKIGWAKNAEISKSNDNKTICIFSDENSAEITFDEKKGKATINISDGRTLDLKVKNKHGKLNICPKIKHGTWLDVLDEFYKKEFYKLHILRKPKKWKKKNFAYMNLSGIVRLRITMRVDSLRDAFLLLLAQNRTKIDSEVIKNFEIYCEDMGKLSAQLKKSSFKPLFTSLTPVVATIFGVIASLNLVASPYYAIIVSILTFFLIYFVTVVLIIGFRGSTHVFREASVPEKAEKNFVLIREYLEVV